jgi:hypothetical protein
MFESKYRSQIKGSSEVLDLTFAVREQTPGGSKCQIRSTHACRRSLLSPESDAHAAGPPDPASIAATRPLTQASRSRSRPRRLVFFGYGQPECFDHAPSGDRLLPRRLAQAVSVGPPGSLTAKLDHAQATARSAGPGQSSGRHGGLAPRPNSGNMRRPWCGTFEVPSRYPALAIRSPNPKAARVLLVSRLPSPGARAVWSLSRTSAKTLGQDLGPRPSTMRAPALSTLTTSSA